MRKVIVSFALGLLSQTLFAQEIKLPSGSQVTLGTYVVSCQSSSAPTPVPPVVRPSRHAHLISYPNDQLIRIAKEEGIGNCLLKSYQIGPLKWNTIEIRGKLAVNDLTSEVETAIAIRSLIREKKCD